MNFYEINTNELNIEKNFMEFLDKFFTKHNKIFVDNYTIGTVGAIRNNNGYRILLVLV